MSDALQKLAQTGIGSFHVANKKYHLDNDGNHQDDGGDIKPCFVHQVEKQKKGKCQQQQAKQYLYSKSSKYHIFRFSCIVKRGSVQVLWPPC